MKQRLLTKKNLILHSVLGLDGGLLFGCLLFRLIFLGQLFLGKGMGKVGERKGVYFTFYDLFQISSR